MAERCTGSEGACVRGRWFGEGGWRVGELFRAAPTPTRPEENAPDLTTQNPHFRLNHGNPRRSSAAVLQSAATVSAIDLRSRQQRSVSGFTPSLSPLPHIFFPLRWISDRITVHFDRCRPVHCSSFTRRELPGRYLQRRVDQSPSFEVNRYV